MQSAGSHKFKCSSRTFIEINPHASNLCSELEKSSNRSGGERGNSKSYEMISEGTFITSRSCNL